MTDSAAPRPARRRGGPRERASAPEFEPVPATEASPAAVFAAPRFVFTPVPLAPLSARETTDFDGLRAIADMSAGDVRALMEEFTGARKSGGFRAGQRVRGRVSSIGEQTVFVDVGGKHDASLDRLEAGEVTLGETIDAFVRSTEGEVRLTRTPSGGAAREMFTEAQAAKLPVNGKVSSVSDSGWQVMLADGVKGFCPGSHTAVNETADPAHVGQTFSFLVHDLRGRDVVLSRRALVEAEERDQATQKLGSLQVNDVVEGTVMSVQDFGAFVKLPNGLQGLVHISNLADRRVKHPSEVVKEGDVVKVRVLGVDAVRRRVDLGMRQAVEMSSGGPQASESGPTGGRAASAGFGVFAALLKDVKVRK